MHEAIIYMYSLCDRKHCASNQKSPRKHSPATPSVLLTPVYHSTVKDSGEKPTGTRRCIVGGFTLQHAL